MGTASAFAPCRSCLLYYIAGLNNIVDELRYQAVLVFIVAVYCYCFVMANMVKYNIMKKKVAVLEDTVEKLEQERAAAMSQAVDEDQKRKIQEALSWFAENNFLRGDYLLLSMH